MYAEKTLYRIAITNVLRRVNATTRAAY